MDDTDKYLIDMAAKAAQLPECGWMGPAFMYVKDNTFTDWSPLKDDGDALRLAVKLNLQINPTVQTDFGPASVAYDGGVGISRVQHGGDGSMATREAIVRAAAEIGEKMK